MSKAKRRAQRAGYVDDTPRCKTCAYFVPPVMRLENSIPTTSTPPVCFMHGHFVRRSGLCRDWTVLW